MDFPEPTLPFADERQVLLGYLDFFREAVLAKCEGIDVHTSDLPSRWTPAELLHHLRHMENRWFVWGFEGRPVADPWADQRDGRWHTTDDLATLSRALREQGATTRRVVEDHDLDEVGQPGERWGGADPAPLRRVLLHVLQEYARHAGHLDVVRELRDGSTGEG